MWFEKFKTIDTKLKLSIPIKFSSETYKIYNCSTYKDQNFNLTTV